MSLNSFQTLHCVSKYPIQVAKYKRLYYDGSNVANGIGPVRLTPEHEGWRKTFGRKKEIYAKARVAVGGSTKGLDKTDTKNPGKKH